MPMPMPMDADRGATIPRMAAATKSKHAVRVLLWLWGAIAFTVTGSLASAHLYTLPHPELASPVLREALALQRGPGSHGRFGLTHVMYAECRCSVRIIDHLVERGALGEADGVIEHVVLVGKDRELSQRLQSAGYPVEHVTPIELKKRYESANRGR